MAFREKYHAGRAIAAPQIGVPKRLIYMYIDRPVVFLNPTLEFPDPERMELLDDCMSRLKCAGLIGLHSQFGASGFIVPRNDLLFNNTRVPRSRTDGAFG